MRGSQFEHGVSFPWILSWWNILALFFDLNAPSSSPILRESIYEILPVFPWLCKYQWPDLLYCELSNGNFKSDPQFDQNFITLWGILLSVEYFTTDAVAAWAASRNCLKKLWPPAVSAGAMWQARDSLWCCKSVRAIVLVPQRDWEEKFSSFDSRWNRGVLIQNLPQ